MNTNTQALREAQIWKALTELQHASIRYAKDRHVESDMNEARMRVVRLVQSALSHPPAPEQASGDRCPFCGGTKGHWEGCKAPDMPSATPTAEPAVEAVPKELRKMLDEFERAAHRKGELWERCQGKFWPDAESDEFTRLRDVVLPELRAMLSASPAAPEAAKPGQQAPLEKLTRLTEEMGLYPWQQAQAGERDDTWAGDDMMGSSS